MNSEVVFLNDGSFKLPYDLKELFVKGMAYTVMLKVGDGIVFLPNRQMGYTVEIPLKYDVVDEDLVVQKTFEECGLTKQTAKTQEEVDLYHGRQSLKSQY